MRNADLADTDQHIMTFQSKVSTKLEKRLADAVLSGYPFEYDGYLYIPSKKSWVEGSKARIIEKGD